MSSLHFNFRLQKAAVIASGVAIVESVIFLGSSPFGLRSRRSQDAEGWHLFFLHVYQVRRLPVRNVHTRTVLLLCNRGNWNLPVIAVVMNDVGKKEIATITAYCWSINISNLGQLEWLRLKTWGEFTSRQQLHLLTYLLTYLFTYLLT